MNSSLLIFSSELFLLCPGIILLLEKKKKLLRNISFSEDRGKIRVSSSVSSTGSCKPNVLKIKCVDGLRNQAEEESSG